MATFFRKKIYPKIEERLNKIARVLSDRGFTPNQLTVAGLALNFVTGWIYASGLFFLGALVLLVAGAADLLDGPLARVKKMASPYGAFLDSTLDRYSDFFLFGGIAIHFARTNQSGWFLIVMGIIAGSFVTSYSKARAENFIESCAIGFFGRFERILLILLSSFLPFLLPFSLWILLIGTNWTAVQRILFTQKALSQKPQEDKQ